MGRFDTKDGNPGRYSLSATAVLNDGDSSALRTDNTGAIVVSGGGATGLAVRETYAPVYEDNTNGVAAVNFKPVAAAAYSATPFMADSDADVVFKSSPGQLFSVYAFNGNAAARWLQVFNQTGVPTTGTPIFSWFIPIGGVVEIGSEFFGENGMYFSAGISVGISTVRATFTAATAADHLINGMYV